MIKNSHETAVEHLYLEFFGKRKIPRLMLYEKEESPLEVAALYGVCHRIKESAGLLIDNKTKKYQDEKEKIELVKEKRGQF
ncbi:hypothetical protein HNQ85_000508 [Anoxybacillus calidus]|jgi:hypothetical protein|uniref:Uncharacterized protein n=1 Tax=[Anoxybacillus] calidus TaxID=575178 RepID=A0A7W0BU64_9BACL|nr:hypothetical protein [Anoxybacillus calidus]